jgi:ABC-type multidrug transport system fused ATPase/permease subunit
MLYGNPAATDADIEEVCMALDLHDFVASMPQAYATQVGEGGSLLSGAQRQRVAIGRALLRRASVLLLEEHMSALDAESRQHVESAVRRFAGGRTVITVTHRLEDRHSFDHVIDFDELARTTPVAA